MYQDKETGEMMLVHHSKIANLEANENFKRPVKNSHDEREHQRMEQDRLINQRIYPRRNTTPTSNNQSNKEASNYPLNLQHDKERKFNMNTHTQNGNRNDSYMEIDLSELNKKSFFK